MTEAEWQACDNVEVMLSSVGCKGTERKVRLFSVACCRGVWDLLPDEWCKNAVALAEQFADGQATDQERQNAHALGMELLGPGDPRNEPRGAALGTLGQPAAQHDGATPLFAEAFGTASAAVLAYANSRTASDIATWHVFREQAESLQLAFLRDIFGPLPFRSVTIDRAWTTVTVTSLAQTIYDERAFDRLPILADALEDAGCTNRDILDHCRQPGEHARGCWVVDLVLGKK